MQNYRFITVMLIIFYGIEYVHAEDTNLKSADSDIGLASMFILLILSLLSLFSLSLFQTSMNNYYVVRNEIWAHQAFYRAQSVAEQMSADLLRTINMSQFSDLNDLSSQFSWLTNEQNTNLQNVDKPSFWQQLTPKMYPPDAQAIAVLLDTQTRQMPSESLIMTNDRHIQTCYFTILAMAEVSGSLAIAELGLRKKIAQ